MAKLTDKQKEEIKNAIKEREGEILFGITEYLPVDDLIGDMHDISEDVESLKEAYEGDDNELLDDIYDFHDELLKHIIVDNIDKIVKGK